MKIQKLQKSHVTLNKVEAVKIASLAGKNEQNRISSFDKEETGGPRLEPVKMLPPIPEELQEPTPSKDSEQKLKKCSNSNNVSIIPEPSKYMSDDHLSCNINYKYDSQQALSKTQNIIYNRMVAKNDRERNNLSMNPKYSIEDNNENKTLTKDAKKLSIHFDNNFFLSLITDTEENQCNNSKCVRLKRNNSFSSIPSLLNYEEKLIASPVTSRETSKDVEDIYSQFFYVSSILNENETPFSISKKHFNPNICGRRSPYPLQSYELPLKARMKNGAIQRKNTSETEFSESKRRKKSSSLSLVNNGSSRRSSRVIPNKENRTKTKQKKRMSKIPQNENVASLGSFSHFFIVNNLDVRDCTCKEDLTESEQLLSTAMICVRISCQNKTAEAKRASFSCPSLLSTSSNLIPRLSSTNSCPSVRSKQTSEMICLCPQSEPQSSVLIPFSSFERTNEKSPCKKPETRMLELPAPLPEVSKLPACRAVPLDPICFCRSKQKGISAYQLKAPSEFAGSSVLQQRLVGNPMSQSVGTCTPRVVNFNSFIPRYPNSQIKYSVSVQADKCRNPEEASENTQCKLGLLKRLNREQTGVQATVSKKSTCVQSSRINIELPSGYIQKPSRTHELTPKQIQVPQKFDTNSQLRSSLCKPILKKETFCSTRTCKATNFEEFGMNEPPCISEPRYSCSSTMKLGNKETYCKLSSISGESRSLICCDPLEELHSSITGVHPVPRVSKKCSAREINQSKASLDISADRDDPRKLRKRSSLKMSPLGFRSSGFGASAADDFIYEKVSFNDLKLVTEDYAGMKRAFEGFMAANTFGKIVGSYIGNG